MGDKGGCLRSKFGVKFLDRESQNVLQGDSGGGGRGKVREPERLSALHFDCDSSLIKCQ